MTWTYSGDPSSSARDEVRFLIGDTDKARQLLSDAEIAWAVANFPSGGVGYPNYRAAVHLINGLVSKYSSSTSKTVGSLSINKGQLVDQLRGRLEDLRGMMGLARAAGGPQLGGGGETYLMSKTGKDWDTQT